MEKRRAEDTCANPLELLKATLGNNSSILTNKWSEIENEEVEDWMQEQLRDLEYDDPDVMEAVRKVLGWRKRKILMEMSYGQFLSALEQTALSEEVRQDVAQGLYNRIQRGVPRTAPAAWSNPRTDCDPILQCYHISLLFCG